MDHVDSESNYSSDEDADSKSNKGSKPVKKGLAGAVKKPTKKSSKVKTYSGIPISVQVSKAPPKKLPAFQTACHKSDHTQGWDDTFPTCRPCPDSCPLMELFKMYICHLGVICKKCKRIIPLRELCRHLHKCHRCGGGTFRKPDYKFVADHIITTHRFMSDTTFDCSGELLEPIQGFNPPTLAYACPMEGCPVWLSHIMEPLCRTLSLTPLAETTKIRSHQRDHRNDLAAHLELQALFAQEAKFKCRYIYRPYGSNVRSVLVFHEGWTPPASLLTPVGHFSTNSTIPIFQINNDVSPSAHFLQALWYPQYIQGLDANQKHLCQLVQVPDRAITKRLKHAPTTHMELGLCTLADILPLYLQDVNTWLDSKHLEVRDAFVCG